MRNWLVLVVVHSVVDFDADFERDLLVCVYVDLQYYYDNNHYVFVVVYVNFAENNVVDLSIVVVYVSVDDMDNNVDIVLSVVVYVYVEDMMDDLDDFDDFDDNDDVDF